jgi:hypothetical protein
LEPAGEKLGSLIKTYPNIHGILNGEYSIPWNILSKLALKTY